MTVLRALADANPCAARAAAASAVLALAVGAIGRNAAPFGGAVRSSATIGLALGGLAFVVTLAASLVVSDGR